MKEKTYIKEPGKRFTRNGIRKLQVVVVVNDDPVQLSHISLLTGKEAGEVHSFSSTDDAMQFMLQSAPPQLIVTDLKMTDTGGRRFCRMVRSREFSALNHVPILAVSAPCAGMDVQSVTVGLGVNGFLEVPCAPDDFRAKVRDLLRGKSLVSKPGFLLLEGNVMFSRSLKKAIQARGHEVHAARRRVDFWRLFHKHRPLAIVIDSVLAGEINGTLMSEIRHHNPRCGVIIVSGQTSGEEATQWIEAGADGYIGRSSRVEEVVALCESASRERAFWGMKDRQPPDYEALKSSEGCYRGAFEAAGDALLIFEEQSGMIVDANEAATRLYRCTREELQAVRFGELAAGEHETCQECEKGVNSVRVWHRRRGGGGFAAGIVIRPFTADRGRMNMAVVRDLSEEMARDREKEQAMVDLEGGLAKNKVLRGLLRICASCKKIKDDRGLWTALELYLSRHSDARFSHSICPDCVKKLYPEHAG